jgi:hypothetical protein
MGLQVIKLQTWTAEALDNTTKSTEWIDCSQLQEGSFSFVWSNGSSLSGEVRIMVANEPNKSDETQLTLSATLTVSGASGAHVANLDDLPNRYVRLRYVGSAGTGNANVWFFGKGDAN